MIRLPRPWSKKRGSRQAGWKLWGAVGEALFFAVLFLLGVLTLSLTLVRQLQNPDPNLLEPGLGFWTLVIASASLVIIGGGSLAYEIVRISASHERRAALAGRAARIDLSSDPTADREDLPAVPRGTRLTESPGIRLRYRLPSTDSPAWHLAAMATLSLGWNAGWMVLLSIAIEGIRAGRPRWFLLLLLVPFAGVGAWLIRDFISLVRRAAGVGPTIVEISDHPLLPGASYELFVTQFGRLVLRRLQIDLVCEEEATYRQGTDVRVERQAVAEQNLWAERNVRIDRGAPWEQQFTFSVPDDAMHSFQSPHNAVRWKVVIQGEAPRWPSYCRSFPVVVRPRPVATAPSQ